MLVDYFVGGAKVGDDVGSSDTHCGAWRIGDPHVFANFYSELCVFDAEEKVDAKWDGMAVNVDYIEFFPFGEIEFETGGEPTFLVEFVVVREIAFGYDSEDFTVLDHCGTVVEPASISYREAYNGCDVSFFCDLL